MSTELFDTKQNLLNRKSIIKTTTTIILAIAFFALGFLSHEARAVIIITETGDWSGNLGSPFLIPDPLGIGLNTISGSLIYEDPEMRDADVFWIANPLGLTITSITLEISNFVATDGSGRLEILLPNSGSVNFSSDGTFNLPVSYSNISDLRFRIMGPEDIFFVAGSADYTIYIQAIPEPLYTALLIGGGVAALILLRKRKMRLGKADVC